MQCQVKPWTVKMIKSGDIKKVLKFLKVNKHYIKLN